MKSRIPFTGTVTRVVLIALTVFVPAAALFSGASPSPEAAPRSGNRGRHCVPVGGMLMTNFGAIDANTTMGIATGDLRGAVSGTIVNQQFVGNTVVFTIQHHWVPESGDTLFFDQASATLVPVSLSQTLLGVRTYTVQLTGGTGKFDGARGDLHLIGEVDAAAGTTIFRYSGQVCFADQD